MKPETHFSPWVIVYIKSVSFWKYIVLIICITVLVPLSGFKEKIPYDEGSQTLEVCARELVPFPRFLEVFKTRLDKATLPDHELALL